MKPKVFALSSLLLILVVFAYVFMRPLFRSTVSSEATPQVRVISMRTVKDQWSFDPKLITLKKGERVKLVIHNEDGYDHGFAIPDFEVNVRLPAGRETTVDLTPTRAGVFGFFCSVPCGENHYEMVGKVVVE